jgi:hypothetical protein
MQTLMIRNTAVDRDGRPLGRSLSWSKFSQAW